MRMIKGKWRRKDLPSKSFEELTSSFEEFTDVKDMPRVSWHKMEERIQNIAKWVSFTVLRTRVTLFRPNGADINLPEWMLSKMMRSAKIRFLDHSLLNVIQVLGRFGNWRLVLQVIEWFHNSVSVSRPTTNLSTFLLFITFMSLPQLTFSLQCGLYS